MFLTQDLALFSEPEVSSQINFSAHCFVLLNVIQLDFDSCLTPVLSKTLPSFWGFDFESQCSVAYDIPFSFFFIYCNLTLIPVSHCCCSVSVPRARRGLSSWILDIYYLFEVRYIEYRYALYSTVIITENYNQFYHQPTLA